MRSTATGSLPFKNLEDARAIVASMDVPFLAELPLLDADEALLRKPFAGLLEPGGSGEARLRVSLDEALAAPVKLGAGATLLSAGGKVQLAGPNVLDAFVTDKKGEPLGDSTRGRELVLARIEKLARALVEALRPSLLVLDEPALTKRGATRLAEAIARVRAPGLAVGVHDCGPDFANAIAAKPDALFFDFASFGTPAALKDFPGVLGWGAVATMPGSRNADAPTIAARVREAAARLGKPLDGFVTPACGTALLSSDEARAVHALAAAVARTLP